MVKGDVAGTSSVAASVNTDGDERDAIVSVVLEQINDPEPTAQHSSENEKFLGSGLTTAEIRSNSH